MSLFLRTGLVVLILGSSIGLCSAQDAKPQASAKEDVVQQPTHGHLAGVFDPTTVLRVAPISPLIERPIRPWVDHTNKRAVVAKLLGRVDGKLLFERADGKRVMADPNSLTLADRALAISQTEPRVNRSAQVLLGEVVTVRDGDTIQVQTIGGENVTIRLDGIDAPESKQDFGLTSKNWLARFTGRTVRVEYFEEDRYRRILGQIYYADRWVNYEMALAGMAWHYSNYNVDQRLAGAHAYAKEKKRGLWQQQEQIAPWDYRNGVRKKTIEPQNVDSIRDSDTVVYITGSGHRYHTESCHHAKDGTPIPLSRATSAYERCNVCKPPE